MLFLAYCSSPLSKRHRSNVRWQNYIRVISKDILIHLYPYPHVSSCGVALHDVKRVSSNIRFGVALSNVGMESSSSSSGKKHPTSQDELLALSDIELLSGIGTTRVLMNEIKGC